MSVLTSESITDYSYRFEAVKGQRNKLGLRHIKKSHNCTPSPNPVSRFLPRFFVLAYESRLTHEANLVHLHNRSFDMNPVSEWRKRAALFYEPQPLAAAVEHVLESSVPEPYRALLVHNEHMTTMMERFHDCQVDVRVIARRTDGTTYSRKIILIRQDTGAVVQFALAQFDLNAVSEAVRREILSEQVPLGRVLVTHKMNCLIEVPALLKVTVGGGLSALLQTPGNVVTYGRVARIFCNAKPTFDVIEISAPIGEAHFA